MFSYSFLRKKIKLGSRTTMSDSQNKNFRKYLCLVINIVICLHLLLLAQSCHFKVQSQQELLKNDKVEDDTSDLVILRDLNGNILLNKSVGHLWQQPLRRWNHEKEILSFIHVEKCGGTSFFGSLKRSRLDGGCTLKCQREIFELGNRTCPDNLLSLCGSHFDWSRLIKTEKRGIKTAAVILLRHPIERFVSHFKHGKFLRLRGSLQYDVKKYLNQTLTEYLKDAESMWESRALWYDGEVSISSSVCRYFSYVLWW